MGIPAHVLISATSRDTLVFMQKLVVPGDPAACPRGRGPQGDEVRIFNYARCVRDAGAR